jgi:hypothetical protein
MKNIILFVLVIIALALAACESPDAPPTGKTTVAPTPPANAGGAAAAPVAVTVLPDNLGSIMWPVAAVVVVAILSLAAYTLLPKLLDQQGQQETTAARANFNGLMNSLAKLKDDDVEQAEKHLVDIKMYHGKLIAETTGFIREALTLQMRLKHIAGTPNQAARRGAIAFYDGAFSGLVSTVSNLDAIDPPANGDTGDELIESDQEIVRGQIMHYALHARFLLNLIVSARGEMAQAEFRLRNIKAGKALADMNRELTLCQKKLGVGAISPSELMTSQPPAQLPPPRSDQ